MAGELLTRNYPVVLDFADLTYFDIRYSPMFEEPGLYWSTDYAGTFYALSIGWKIRNIPYHNNESTLVNIQGVEGALWSELIPTSEHLFYMLLPKMLGLAEASWSPENSLNWRSLAYKLGCGVTYRGYPDGISQEIPPNTLCKRQ